VTSDRLEGLEEFFGAQLSLFTFIHHQDDSFLQSLSSVLLHSDDFSQNEIIIEHILIKFTKGVILGIICEGTP
jgi:hypothetical protein